MEMIHGKKTIFFQVFRSFYTRNDKLQMN